MPELSQPEEKPTDPSRQPNEALIRAREERGWSQSEAASRIGCSLEALQNWERGRRKRIQPRFRIKLCEVYERSLEELNLYPPPRRAQSSPGQTRSPAVISSMPSEHKEMLVEVNEQAGTPEALMASADTDHEQATYFPQPPKGEKSRRTLLARVRKNWLEEEYQHLVPHGHRITFEVREYPQALAQPRFYARRNGSSGDHPLRVASSLSSFYHLTGEVLLLGDRGAGKTTLLLELLGELLACAEQQEEELLPVVFPLASWSGKQTSLAEWLVEVLDKDYFMARDVARNWVETDRLIILLDGLDKVSGEVRQTCVEAIDAYQDAHPEVPLVVCSQTEEYFAQSFRLRFSQAVQVQPLTSAQIIRYLDGMCTVPSFCQTMREDPALLEMCANPFILNVMVRLVNRGEGQTAMTLVGSIEERRKQLFDLYVRQQYEPPKKPSYSQSQMFTSLSWLAQQMKAHHQEVFYPERMQPTWLPDTATQQQYRLWTMRFVIGISVFIFSGLLACFRGDLIPHDPGLFFWLGGGRGDSVLGWMAPGIGGGMLGATSLSLLFALVIILVQLWGDNKRIPLTLTPKKVRSALLAGLRWGLVIGGMIGIITGIIFSRRAGLTCLGGSLSGVACGSSVGVFGGIIAGFHFGLFALLKYKQHTFPQKTERKQTHLWVKDRLLNALLFSGCSFLSFLLIYSWQAGGINRLALAYALVAGIYFGLLYHRGVGLDIIPEIGIEIRLAETVAWSWQAVCSHLLENLKKGALLAGILLVCVITLITCLSSLFYGLSYGIRYGLVYGSIVAVISGVTGCLMGVVTSGWSQAMLDDRAFARTNEGVRRAMRHALFAAGLFGPLGGLTCGLVSMLVFALGGVPGWPILGTGLGIILTLACSYQIFTLYGGIALIEHVILRWFLWRKKCLPWDSIAFGNHAVEQAFLKRWGRGYMFIHTLLEEYFAHWDDPS